MSEKAYAEKKRAWILAHKPRNMVAVVSLTFVLMFLTSGCLDMERQNQPRIEYHVGEIRGPTKVGQSFVAMKNGLKRVSITMGTYGRRNHYDVVFHLEQLPEEEDLPKEFAGPPVGEIYGDMKVGQTFFSYTSELKAIKLLMANYDSRQNTEDVIFHLRKKPGSKEDLRTLVVNASEILDNEYHKFEFDSLTDSQRKRYYFFIESPTSSPGNAITVRYTPENTYAAGKRFSSHRPASGDLVFESVGSSELARVVVNASQIKHMQYQNFAFPPIPDSEGRSYYFYLESPDSRAGDAVTVYYETGHEYVDGERYVNDEVAPGDLTFRTYYGVTLGEVMAPFADHVQKDKPFLVLFILVFATVFVFLMVVSVKILVSHYRKKL